jgi:photosystem II stability/assembly factor-like uncharacterized protein
VPIVLALVLLATAGSSTATPPPAVWTALGPAGSQVLAFAASPAAPGVLYAATDDRVWKSLDSGETWSPTGDGPSTLSYSLVADPADGDNVLAGSFNGELWVTSDGGATWAPPGSGWPASSWPLLSWSSAGLFALAGGTLYTSSEGGDSWTALGTPPDGAERSLLVVSSTAIYVGTELGTVEFSDDGGLTWADRSSGLPTEIEPDYPYPPSIEQLVSDPADSQVLYAELNPLGLFRSPDGGASWVAVASPLVGKTLERAVTLATTPTTLVATAGLDVVRSTNGGASWTVGAEPPFGSAFKTLFFPDPSSATTLYLGDFGVFRSTDAGDTFAFSSTGLGKTGVHALTPVPGCTGCYLAATASGVMRTDDDGASWEHRSSGVRGQTLELASDPTNPNRFYLAAAGDVWRTNDGGASWQAANTGITGVARAVAADASKVYTGADGTVYRSSDGADSWTASPLPLAGVYINALAIDPTDGERVYAGTTSGLFRSPDGGSSWTRIDPRHVSDITVAPDGMVYVVANSGVSAFTPEGTGLPLASIGLTTSVYSLATQSGEDDYVYAGTAQGVYQTADGGQRWVKLLTNGLESQFVSDLVPRGDHLMIATARGTAKVDLAPPTVTVDNAQHVTTTTADLAGWANPMGTSATAFFEYGTTRAYGTATPATALGEGTEWVPVTASLSGLSHATTYHFRLVAQSAEGMAAGPDQLLRTDFLEPTASTSAAGQLTPTAATLNGSVNPRGGLTSYWFEYGPDSSYGSQTSDFAAGAGVVAVSVSANLTGLEPATTYHYRVAAENAKGATFGLDRQFTTNPLPPTMAEVEPLTLRSGGLEGGSIPVHLSWTATPGTSPICNYQLQRGTAVDPPYGIGQFPAGELQGGELPTVGVYYRVQALACDGSTSDYVSSPPATVRLAEESAATVSRSRGWSLRDSKDASGHRVLRTTVPGSWVAFTFTGRSLAWIAPKGPLYAAVSVSLDGGPPTSLPLYQPTRSVQGLVYLVNLPTVAKHRVVITARAASDRRRVDVDAFAVIR